MQSARSGVSTESWALHTGLFVVVLSTILLAGGIRLAVYPPAAGTVRIASLSAKDFPSRPGSQTWDRLTAGKATDADIRQIQDWAKMVDEDLLARSTVAAQAGAKLVFWGEGNAPILKQDELGLLSEGSRLAAENHIYLGMAIGAYGSGGGKLRENKLVMIDPAGHIAWQYEKAHPVPGEEAAIMVAGDGQMRILDTPFGRLAGAICFDVDYPQTIAQAGARGAAILLNPSNDWRAIDPWHAQMASFRAIEQGTSVIHQASHGLSAAYDYEGNRLAALDYFRSDSQTMISEVPAKGIRTIYSRFGDWFARLSCAAFLALAFQVFFLERYTRSSGEV
jgi:apolipoprotein N-acyltransferase